MRNKLLLTLALVLALPTASRAQITIPYTFVDGTTIVAAQVNANFSALGLNAVNRAGSTMTGVLKLSDGNAPAPAVSFASEPTTGVFRPAAGSIALGLLGAEQFRLDASGLAWGGGAAIASSAGVATLAASNVFTNNVTFTAAAPTVNVIATAAAGANVRVLGSDGLGQWMSTRSAGLLEWIDSAYATTNMSLSNVGALTVRGLITTGSATLMASSVNLTNGAAAQAATLTNAPAAGNPTKWIPINDNGTVRYIPVW